jgi:hypothetical protein
MRAWRILGSFILGIAWAASAGAQTYELVETPKVGDCLQINLTMSLTGQMHVTKNDKPIAMNLTTTAEHAFPERVLAVSPKGLIQKSARAYETAKVINTIDGNRSEINLRAERRLQVAQVSRGQTMTYCPAGPLTPEEQELTGEHFDTLALPGLLPGKAVAVGETWKLTNEVVQGLCNFEGLTSQDITCKLDEVKNQMARVTLAGPATGIDLGALVKMTVEGSYQFDLASKRLVALEWKQKDDRGQGPASPATTVESSTTLKRSPIAQPASLSEVALISVPDGNDVPAQMTFLAYHHAAKTPFDLVYERGWQLVGQTPDRVIFRLLDRGDFVAQATITPWESAAEGKHMTPEAFKEAMAKTPGWEQGEIVDDGPVPTDKGRWIYRVSAPGLMDGLKVVQNFYLVAAPGGEQIVLAFTMIPNQAEKLGTRDLNMVLGVEILGKQTKRD